MKRFYPIGTPGVAWGAAEKAEWLAKQSVKRSYKDLVLGRIEALKGDFEVTKYGELSIDPARYPLFVVQTKAWQKEKPSVLITGGVHGYETSGVKGALMFLETAAKAYEKHFNVVVFPCVSPWAFETINRNNHACYDVNRFWGMENSPVEECALAMAHLAAMNPSVDFLAHIDLHETTNTDESEFMPAKAAMAGLEYKPLTIPDGFYLMASMEDAQLAWHEAMIAAVRPITHIAPADEENNLVGLPVISEGIVHEMGAPDNICSGYKPGTVYATTTEVYPDSAKTNDEECNKAQVACITGGLDWLVANPDKW